MKKLNSTKIGRVLASTLVATLIMTSVAPVVSVYADNSNTLYKHGNQLTEYTQTNPKEINEKKIEMLDPNHMDVVPIKKDEEKYVSTNEEEGVELPLNKKDNIIINGGSEKIEMAVSSVGNDQGVVEDNTVFYNGKEASVGVQALENGARQVIILKNEKAPLRYDFTYKLENKSYLKFAQLEDGTQDGSIIIYNKQDEPIGMIDPPWAKDNNGMPVNTHYEINGTTLTQVIEPTTVTAYPVIADPSVYSWYFKSGKWITRGGVRSLSLKPNLALRTSVGLGGASIAIAQSSWLGVKSKFKTSKYWKNERSIYNQYICHFYFAFYKSEFNLEPHRKTVSLAKTIARKCNP